MPRRTAATLPRQTQDALARLAAAGDRRAAGELIAGSRGFILSRVRRYAKAYLADDSALEEDLVAEGERGMFEALLRFDVTRKLHPLTYCAHWIDLRVRNALTQAAGPASVGSPQHWRESGHPRTHGQEIDEALADSLPLDEPSALESLLTFEFGHLRAVALKDALDTLDPTDRRIVNLRFLVPGNRRPTLYAVGRVVGLSRERTRQREIGALKQLLEALGVPSDRLEALRKLTKRA